MKWNGTGRSLKALGVSLAIGLGMTACSRDYTIGYLYVTTAKATPGLINAYAIDYQSGALTQLADSPIPSGGNNPVMLVSSPKILQALKNTGTSLGVCVYVLNHDAPSSNVVQFNTGTDGKLYAANTYSVVQGNGKVGTFPTAAAIDAQGLFLYVTFTYQNGFTTVNPGPGGVAVYPINQNDGTLGAPLTNTTVGTTTANPLPYFPVGDNPVGIVTSQKGNNVYVIDQEKPTSAAPFGVVLTFSENLTTGTLTPVAGAVSNGVAAGVQPTSIAEDPSGHFLYVTDSLTNLLYGYTITASGAPAAMISSPFTTGMYPTSVTIDPRGLFVYVANFASSTVSSYAINQSTGALSGSGGNGGVSTGPVCVTIEPALGIYLFTANNTDNSVSAEQLDPHTGSLKAVQGTQFSAAGLPTCAIAVANGDHATQIVE